MGLSEIGRLSIQAFSVAMTADDVRQSAENHDFAVVFETTFPTVLRYVLARVGDPILAEDLVGDVYEQAVRGWSRFEGRSTPRTWLLGIARHVISHHLRRNTPTTLPLEAAPFEYLEDRSDGPEVLAERNADGMKLRRALNELSSRDRELLALKYSGDLTNREVAGVLGVREVTARVRLHRATSRLAQVLEKMEEPT